jgi:hypothetical protein
LQTGVKFINIYFIQAFFVPKCFAQLFPYYSLALIFIFGQKKMGAKAAHKNFDEID